MKNMIFTEENIYQGNLVLINRDFPICDALYDLSAAVNKYPDIKLQKHVSAKLQKLISVLKCDEKIIPVSGYRSSQEQVRIYYDSIIENGEDFTEKFVALPDHSEHQSGLAIDLALKKDSVDFICPDFPDSGICGKFRKLAPLYGFILRYPKGKENITCISHEPWHFRYTGYPHSQIIEEKGFTLEEYMDFIKQYTKYKSFLYEDNLNITEIFYLPLDNDKEAKLSLPDNCSFQVSGNNMDGIIVTVFHNSKSNKYAAENQFSYSPA